MYRKLILDWGDCAIEISRLPNPPESYGVSRANPIRLIEVDSHGAEKDLKPSEANPGREIAEYLTNRNYWMTDQDLVSEADDEYQYPEIRCLRSRPDWSADLFFRLFHAVDRGELSLAKSIMAEIEREVGSDDDIAKAGVIIQQKEILGN